MTEVCDSGGGAPHTAKKSTCVSMYPHRPAAEAFNNAVDVVELLIASIDQAPNVRHIRVLHTFNSMMSLVLLIQQDVEEGDEFCQHDSVVTVKAM